MCLWPWLLTLVFVPAFFLVMDDFGGLLDRIFGRFVSGGKEADTSHGPHGPVAPPPPEAPVPPAPGTAGTAPAAAYNPAAYRVRSGMIVTPDGLAFDDVMMRRFGDRAGRFDHHGAVAAE